MNYIVTFFLGISSCIMGNLFFRYFRLRKNKVPALNYCLTMLVMAFITNIVHMLLLILPDDFLMLLGTLTSGLSIWSSALLLLIVITLNSTDEEKRPSVLFERMLLFFMLAVTPLLLTNNFHHLIIVSIEKSPNGFDLIGDFGVLGTFLSVFSVLLYLLIIAHLFWPRKEKRPLSLQTRFLLLLSPFILPAISILEFAVPLLKDLRISTLFIWVPVSLVCYLFFGHVESSRQSAIAMMEDAYIVFDMRGYCVDINEAGVRFFEQWMNTKQPRITEFIEKLQVTDISDISEYEIALPMPDNSLVYYSITGVNKYKTNEKYVNAFIIREITEYKVKIDRLSSDAEKDPLTGAKNRRALLYSAPGILEQLRQKEQPLATMMIDIDFFKKVNDVYGHLAGDAVLSGLVRILEENARASDIVFRYGGEEFLVLCQSVPRKNVEAMAERIRQAVEEYIFQAENQEIKITVSIGVYVAVPQIGDRIEAFIERADQLLYKAKEGGRNRVEI